MRHRAADAKDRLRREGSRLDPAEVVIAWEAVEELLASVPESPTKDILRLVAAGLAAEEIGERMQLPVAEVEALTARGRMRVLTAAITASRSSPST